MKRDPSLGNFDQNPKASNSNKASLPRYWPFFKCLMLENQGEIQGSRKPSALVGFLRQKKDCAMCILPRTLANEKNRFFIYHYMYQ
jgi:hypothetical protein